MSYRSRFEQTSYGWGYSSDKRMYHGLWNHGSTCYLNSVLQVLFMTKEFRQNLKVTRDEDRNIIDHELTELFGELEKNTANIHKIITKLEISNVYEQRDAAEYFERILRLTSEGASEVFHGELINRNTCSRCETGTDISAAFWYLPLALVDSSGDYSVLKGVTDLFRPSELSGENQMYCERCADKSDATITCVVKRHPEVLVLLLKRFEFDTRYMSYVKLCCAVDVPFKLQIPQDQTYELFAFVDHVGSLRSGHYTTTIRSQDNDEWYKFDDHIVSQYYQWFQLDKKEKLCNAYLLFYRKVVPAGTSSQDVGVVSTAGVQQDEVRMKKDGLETGDPLTRDVDTNAAASVSTEGVLKRPVALTEPLLNRDDEGDDGGDVRQNKSRHQQDRDEDKDPGHTRIKRQKEDNDEKYRTVNDQRRTEADEGVKNDGLGGQSDPQNTQHDFMQYVPENQTRWGKQDDIGDKTWIKMEEKGRREPEHQKNKEFHHVLGQNRQKVVPDPANVQRPSEDEETDSVGTSSAQVERFSRPDELNQEVTPGKREGCYGVSDVNTRHNSELFRATYVNRDNGDDGDDKKRSEKLVDMRENLNDNLKERRQYDKYEDKTGYNLGKADHLYERNRTSDERNNPEEGFSDSSRRCDDQREDRKDVQGPDDGPTRRGHITYLRECSVSIQGDVETLKYELTKPKGGESHERRSTEENANKMEQRSRSSERSRRTSERDTNSRWYNPQRNRSPEQRFSPTQTEAELHLKGRSVGKGHSDDRYQTYERPPTNGAAESRRRVKSETDAQNNSNNHQVRPENQSDAQDALNSDMKHLNLIEKPSQGIEGLELEANGKPQAKRKNDENTFTLCCYKFKKAKQIESEDL